MDRVIVLDDGRVTEVLDVRQPPAGPLRYQLSVDAPDERVRRTFPDWGDGSKSPRQTPLPPPRASATEQVPFGDIADRSSYPRRPVQERSPVKNALTEFGD